MTITVIPWFRDFLAEFLKQETDEALREMGIRFERAFPEDQWRSGASYYILDFYDSEIAALTSGDGWQRIYDAMKLRRKEGRNVSGRRWEYNYITQRMAEFVGLTRKLTGGAVTISTKRKKAPVETPPAVLLQDVVQCPKGCIPENFERHKEAAQRVLDELQACIVLAGGRKLSIQELSNMTLAEALFLCLPNNISLKASQLRLPRTSPDLT